MKALLIVDLQNDFLPEGALPAPNGNKVVPVINKLMEHFSLIIASKDWHPANSVHFKKWPVHCVAGSKGAEFPFSLNRPKIDLVLYKGTNDLDDGYSAFEATNISLDQHLKMHAVNSLYICGLTTEYCVKNTVLDALKAGYETFVVQDATAGVNAHPGDEKAAWDDMQKAGAKLTTAAAVTGA